MCLIFYIQYTHSLSFFIHHNNHYLLLPSFPFNSRLPNSNLLLSNHILIKTLKHNLLFLLPLRTHKHHLHRPCPPHTSPSILYSFRPHLRTTSTDPHKRVHLADNLNIMSKFSTDLADCEVDWMGLYDMWGEG